ncbi:MAG: hypothetical protein KAS32_30720 [Candidatus Peribacteraceae bacterium]|nr:hypothetical protein [Candidatus Peribacteraceae bacterium]
MSYTHPNKLHYRGYTIYQEDVNRFYIEVNEKSGCIRCTSYEQALKCINALEGDSDDTPTT